MVYQGAVTLTVPDLLTLMKYQQCLNNTINWSNKVGLGANICHGYGWGRRADWRAVHCVACRGPRKVCAQLVWTLSVPAAKVPRQHSARALHERSSGLAGSSASRNLHKIQLLLRKVQRQRSARTVHEISSGIAGSTFSQSITNHFCWLPRCCRTCWA